MKQALSSLALIGASLLLSSCAGTRDLPPLPVVSKVELTRFMGDWYVIANIPTILERGAHNAIENYRLDEDGTIATTFTYRKDSFDGKPKRYTPRGFVLDRQTNAIWGMRFIWPVKSDYRIVYLDEGYQTTVVGRQKRDYVWIMARTPSIPEAQYLQLLDLLGKSGYDTSKIEKVPQQWP